YIVADTTLQHTCRPNNEEESFYIVPPNVHSASEAAYNNDQVAVARQRMAQHYLDKNRQLHQLMATESGIQLNRAYDLDGLVTIQQKCVQVCVDCMAFGYARQHYTVA
ncbi:hypothetical protein, variant, partial [Sphaeroforma arctica JP610]